MILSKNNQAKIVSIKNTVATFSEGLESVIFHFDLPTTILLTNEEANCIAGRCYTINNALASNSSLKNFPRSAYDDFVFLYSSPFPLAGIEDKRYAVLKVNVLQRLIQKGKISIGYLIDEEHTYDIEQLLPVAKKSEKPLEYAYDVVKTSDEELICLRDIAKEALEREKQKAVEKKKTPERLA